MLCEKSLTLKHMGAAERSIKLSGMFFVVFCNVPVSHMQVRVINSIAQ